MRKCALGRPVVRFPLPGKGKRFLSALDLLFLPGAPCFALTRVGDNCLCIEIDLRRRRGRGYATPWPCEERPARPALSALAGRLGGGLIGVWRSTSIKGTSTARSGVDTGVASQGMGLGLVMGLGALPRVRSRIPAKTRIQPAAIPGQTGWVFAGFLVGYLKREEAWRRALDWPLAQS